MERKNEMSVFGIKIVNRRRISVSTSKTHDEEKPAELVVCGNQQAMFNAPIQNQHNNFNACAEDVELRGDLDGKNGE